MTHTIEKALHSADALLKGGTSPLRAVEYEQAMMDHADRQRAAGEDSAAAFARLVKSRDATVELLWAAADLARTFEHHGDVLRKRGVDDRAQHVLRLAEANLDTCVKMNQQPGESVEQTTARLARDGDATFSKVYSALVETRRLVAG
jgi:methylthioribose-1-phosphate isomerase